MRHGTGARVVSRGGGKCVVIVVLVVVVFCARKICFCVHFVFTLHFFVVFFFFAFGRTLTNAQTHIVWLNGATSAGWV